MSNSTITYMSNNDNPYQYSTIVLGILFFTSEVLPFLKSKDKHNGIIDTLICLLRGSACVAQKVADTLDTGEVKTSDIEAVIK